MKEKRQIINIEQTDEEGYSYILVVKKDRDGSFVIVEDGDNRGTFVYIYPSQVNKLIKFLGGVVKDE